MNTMLRCPANEDRKHGKGVVEKFGLDAIQSIIYANIFHEAKKADGFLRFPIRFR
jgi:hypothetical protein